MSYIDGSVGKEPATKPETELNPQDPHNKRREQIFLRDPAHWPSPVPKVYAPPVDAQHK